ncbi:uncharacterized protein [Amphiura filiformis]|uniref:uncharacterized protein n=1 Tax=Amphiura filiformis TaxID=82378 RepID=UPI003B219383
MESSCTNVSKNGGYIRIKVEPFETSEASIVSDKTNVDGQIRTEEPAIELESSDKASTEHDSVDIKEEPFEFKSESENSPLSANANDRIQSEELELRSSNEGPIVYDSIDLKEEPFEFKSEREHSTISAKSNERIQSEELELRSSNEGSIEHDSIHVKQEPCECNSSSSEALAESDNTNVYERIQPGEAAFELRLANGASTELEYNHVKEEPFECNSSSESPAASDNTILQEGILPKEMIFELRSSNRASTEHEGIHVKEETFESECETSEVAAVSDNTDVNEGTHNEDIVFEYRSANRAYTDHEYDNIEDPIDFKSEGEDSTLSSNANERIQSEEFVLGFSNEGSILHDSITLKEEPCECKSECETSEVTAKSDNTDIDLEEEPFECNSSSEAIEETAGLDSSTDYVDIQDINEKQFECSSCNESFARFILLIEHECIHSRGKSFECKYCDKCFTTSSDLKNTNSSIMRRSLLNVNFVTKASHSQVT